MDDRPTLPPGLARADEPVADPAALEAAGWAMHEQAARAIVAGVEVCAEAFVVNATVAILDAWNRCSDAERDAAERAIRADAPGLVARVVADLEALFTADPEQQRATPLQIVRRLIGRPTEILRGAGIPPIERDAFATRADPDDDYGLAPATLADLGDPDLGPLMLAWGLAKSNVIRARRAAEGGASERTTGGGGC